MKGISPIVAAVLLIAVTLTLAGALSYWASSFVSTQVSSFGNTSGCNIAYFTVYRCSYNTSSSTLNFILNNQRQVNLNNLQIQFVSGISVTNATSLNGTLSPGLQSYTLTAISPFDKFVISTPQCPDLRAESDCK